MNFNFNTDQEQLRDAVHKWAERDYPFERRLSINSGNLPDTSVLKELAGLGLMGLAIPEEFGGLEMGPVEAMVVLEELGRALVSAPFAQTALIAPALLRHASPAVKSVWLPRISAGDALVVLAHQERESRYELERVATKAINGSTGWTIIGSKRVVPAGDKADAYIVPARISGAGNEKAGIGLFLVQREASGISTKAYRLHDGSAGADVAFDNSSATLIEAGDTGFDSLEFAIDTGISALAAEAVGVMECLLQLTTEYLNTRKQFGVALSSFQALRHRIADCKMQLELGRSMSYYAALKLQESPEIRRRAISQAKVQVGRSVRFLGQECLQLHGGIGMTDEYAGSHYFKKLTCMEMTFGDTQHHLGQAGVLMNETAGVFV